MLFVATTALTPLRRAPAAPLLPDRPASWSNPLGTSLTQIGEEIWLAERPFYPRLPGLQSTDVGCKACIVRLPSGSLWVHAPVGLDDSLRAALGTLGPVSHVVTPNNEHQKYAASWIEEYPDAQSYACPGLREKRPEVGWGRSLDSLLDAGSLTAAAPPAEWEGALDLCWVQDRIPLTGVFTPPISFFNEVVFFHRASATLIVTDLWWNYPAGGTIPRSSRLWKAGMDRVYRPVYNRFMKTPSCDASYATILGWDFEYIAPSHGEPVSEGGRRVLAEHLDLAGRGL